MSVTHRQGSVRRVAKTSPTPDEDLGLQELIIAKVGYLGVGNPSHKELERRSQSLVSWQRWQQLRKHERAVAGWQTPRTQRGIASAIAVSEWAVVRANAV